MDKNTSKSWYKKWWVWVIGAVLIIGLVNANGDKDTTSNQAKQPQTNLEQKKSDTADQPTQEVTPPPVPQPESQKQFLAQIETAKTNYKAASTELQRSEAVRNRNAQLCNTVGSKFTDWVGTVKDIGANREGKAHVSIEIAPTVKVSTWNNAVSDYDDQTLINPGSELFDRLVKMEKGAKVTLTGNFKPSDGSCVKTSNLTETFGVLDPDFIVSFTDVREK